MLALRWILAGIFLRSGLSKTGGLAEFRTAVGNYRLLPAALVAPVAITLPFAEIGGAVLLIVGVLPVIVAALLAALLVVFAVAIAVNLSRGRVFDCGCGGTVAPQLISWRHVVTDLVLAAVAAAVAIVLPAALNLWRGPAGLTSVSVPGGSAFPLVLTVLIIAVMAAVLQRFVPTYRQAMALSADHPAH
jgi:uncharacterized membrane protein YphA (DoxX/SURF4 family)